MAWTKITRQQYARRKARYASDMTDREWGLVQPFLPVPRRLGRPRTTDLREVVNALLYIASTGCQWRMLPKDFPPSSTVQGGADENLDHQEVVHVFLRRQTSSC
ncbi:hypothetical protein RvVAR0630_34240 [Agrobacterium vitis]|nr:hypothetical protein RvVAR0630_34240 [Agrobacterium vitis]